MSVKSKEVIAHHSDGPLPYPKLMINNASDIVVLFKEDCCGTVIIGNDICLTGYYSEWWGMDDFTDYKGTIELTNG